MAFVCFHCMIWMQVHLLGCIKPSWSHDVGEFHLQFQSLCTGGQDRAGDLWKSQTIANCKQCFAPCIHWSESNHIIYKQESSCRFVLLGSSSSKLFGRLSWHVRVIEPICNVVMAAFLPSRPESCLDALAPSLGWEALSPAPQMECALFRYLSFICFLPASRQLLLAKGSLDVFRHGLALDHGYHGYGFYLFQSFATESPDYLSTHPFLFPSLQALHGSDSRAGLQWLGAAMPGRFARNTKKLWAVLLCYCDLLNNLLIYKTALSTKAWGFGSYVSCKCSEL